MSYYVGFGHVECLVFTDSSKRDVEFVDFVPLPGEDHGGSPEYIHHLLNRKPSLVTMNRRVREASALSRARLPEHYRRITAGDVGPHRNSSHSLAEEAQILIESGEALQRLAKSMEVQRVAPVPDPGGDDDGYYNLYSYSMHHLNRFCRIFAAANLSSPDDSRDAVCSPADS